MHLSAEAQAFEQKKAQELLQGCKKSCKCEASTNSKRGPFCRKLKDKDHPEKGYRYA